MIQVRRDAFVLLMVCATLVAACTTHGRLGVLPAVLDTEQGAEIVVIREWRFVGSGANVTISLDGVALYGIAVDEHVVLRVPPGDHIVTVSRRGPLLNDAATSVRTEPKRRYYYRLETSTWSGDISLLPVAPSAGEDLIKKTQGGEGNRG